MEPELTTDPYHLLIRYLRPRLGRVALLLALTLGSITLQLIAPQILGRFLDAATTGAGLAESRLYKLAILFFVTVLSQKIIGLAAVYLTEDLGWATTNELRSDLTAHVLRLDMGFHKLRTPGELIERIDSDISNMAEYFAELVTEVLANALLVTGVIVLLFWEAWPAGLIGLAYAAVILLFLRAIQNRFVGYYKQISQASAELYGFLEERLAGTEDIRGNGGEAYMMSRLYPLLNTHAALRTRTYTIGSFTGSFSTFLYGVAIVAILAYGAYAYLQQGMSIGTVFVLFTYITVMSNPVNSVRRHIGNLQRALASIGRIGEFFAIAPEAAGAGTAVLPNSAPAVVFRDVSFAYKDRRPQDGEPDAGESATAAAAAPAGAATPIVLHDVGFALSAGAVLGVLGRTGSGKTTLTRLLFRLYDVDAGAITLDGVDLREADLDDLRRHVGLVTQDVQLFAATVRDNLTLFRNLDPAAEPISDEQIIAALETLGLGDWYRGLPDGLDTLLRSGGQGLSAGEAQLLAFTRVFLRNPQLVILDEASSRLDPATEQLLERAIDRLLAGRTGIVIAHRLKTVQRAGAILILEDGRVVEFGERHILAADPTSRFSHLLQTGLEEVLV